MKMKKVVALFMAVVCVFSMLAVSASAATKSDLLTEAAKSPVYKYVKVSLENAARTIEVTDAQADECMPYVQKIVSVLDEDNGPGVYDHKIGKYYYTTEQVSTVMDCINKIAEILGLVAKTEFVGEGDSKLCVYDKAGKLIFEYDGDAVADTAAATSVDTAVIVGGAVALLIAGAAALVSSKKRFASVEA